MSYNPNYKWINPTYPIYNWGYNPLTKWDEPPSIYIYIVYNYIPMYGPITGIPADRLHGPGDADGHLRAAREDAAWLFNARMKPRRIWGNLGKNHEHVGKIWGNPRETS